MPRTSKLFALLALAATIGAAGPAPADRYFGMLHMSTLRIRYEIMQTRARYEYHHLLPQQAEHLLDLDENAFEAWAYDYPQDPWLASTAYLMAQLYAELPGASAAGHAKHLYGYIASTFPKTSYAHESRAALKRGVPVRPQPAWAMQTPAPSTSPSVTPSTAPAAAGSPAPALSASPQPTGTP